MTKPENPSPDLSALSPLARELAHTVARVASDIAVVVDDDGVIRDVAEGSAGLAPGVAGWVGRRWVDTASADSRAKIEQLLDEARLSGVTRRREVNHPASGGSDLPLAWTAIRLGEGGPLLAVGRDLRAVAAIQQRFLDAQHEMERGYWRRRQAEGRWQLLYQVAFDAVWLVDAATLEVLDANPAAVAQSPASPRGARLPELLPPSAHSAVLELMTSARTSGRAGEIAVRGPEGQLQSNLSATPLRVGGSLHMLVRARPAQSGLDGPAEDPMVAMTRWVETTDEALVIVDSAGRIQMVNAAFVALLQAGGETALRGRRLTSEIGDPEGHWAAALAAATQRGVLSSRVLNRLVAGKRQQFEVSAILLTEGEQEGLGIRMRRIDVAAAEGASDDGGTLRAGLAGLEASLGSVPMPQLLERARLLVERHLVQSAWLRGDGDAARVAALLGITVAELETWQHRLGLQPPPRAQAGQDLSQ